MISMVVIAVLIGLLVPTLGGAQETARRVVCQSNIRQIGLGVVMYADDHRGRLPVSQFLSDARYGGRSIPEPQNMLTLRVGHEDVAPDSFSEGWDGMGLLFRADYLSAPKIFYCPSHRGNYTYSRMVDLFNDSDQEIVGNYHFRGAGPTRSAIPGNANSQTFDLYRIDPAQSSLIADGMREASDYNHRSGVNFFRADLTVHWFSDHNGALSMLLPESKDLVAPDDMAAAVNSAWGLFDASANQPH